jgi:hypothetical protein
MIALVFFFALAANLLEVEGDDAKDDEPTAVQSVKDVEPTAFQTAVLVHRVIPPSDIGVQYALHFDGGVMKDPVLSVMYDSDSLPRVGQNEATDPDFFANPKKDAGSAELRRPDTGPAFPICTGDASSVLGKNTFRA